MTRCVSIYNVLGLWALIVFLTGCAAEKEPLIVSLKKSGTGVSLSPIAWQVARSSPHCFWGRVSECQGLLLLRCSFGRHR